MIVGQLEPTVMLCTYTRTHHYLSHRVHSSQKLSSCIRFKSHNYTYYTIDCFYWKMRAARIKDRMRRLKAQECLSSTPSYGQFRGLSLPTGIQNVVLPGIWCNRQRE